MEEQQSIRDLIAIPRITPTIAVKANMIERFACRSVQTSASSGRFLGSCDARVF